MQNQVRIKESASERKWSYFGEEKLFANRIICRKNEHVSEFDEIKAYKLTMIL